MTGARVRTYAELRRALAARRRALGMTQEAMNDRAGLAGGYVNKLEVGIRHFGDMSLDAVLGALGLEIVLVVAVDRPKMLARKAPQAVGFARLALPAPVRTEKKLHLTRQEKGGRARAVKLSPEQRAAIASKAAAARWKRHFSGKRRECKPRKQDTPPAPCSGRGRRSGRGAGGRRRVGVVRRWL